MDFWLDKSFLLLLFILLFLIVWNIYDFYRWISLILVYLDHWIIYYSFLLLLLFLLLLDLAFYDVLYAALNLLFYFIQPFNLFLVHRVKYFCWSFSFTLVDNYVWQFLFVQNAFVKSIYISNRQTLVIWK